MTNADLTLSQLMNKIDQFNKERGWEKHHTLKNLAMSIGIEASELAENFQWTDPKYFQSLEDEQKENIRHLIYIWRLKFLLNFIYRVFFGI